MITYQERIEHLIEPEKEKPVAICCPHCGYWYNFKMSDLLEAFGDGTFECVWCWEDIDFKKEGFTYLWKG